MNDFLENIKNIIDFFIRKNTKFSRRNYKENNEDKTTIFDSILLEKEQFLKKKYNLSCLDNSTIQNYKENLYVLSVLDKYLKIDFAKECKIADIGSKNWNYVKGEYIFFSKFADEVSLKGYEIDAYRLCTNLYSRYEIAQFYISSFSNVEYIEADFLKIDEKFDFITWFLPFIKKYSHQKWGLPASLFNPKGLLLHAYNSLNKNGKMLIINQEIEEYNLQKEFLKDLSIDFDELGKVDNDFLELKKTRYGLLISKK